MLLRALGKDTGALGISVMISGHRKRELADGEQRGALRLIKNRPESTARCVPRAPLTAHIEGALFSL